MAAMPAGLRDRPLVLVDDLDAPVLATDDLHHFERVLRVATGDEITLGDGRGRWRVARFGPTPEPTGGIEEVARPEQPITVAFSPVKGERPEWFVQKLTELGVDEIVPVTTDRTVVRWDAARAAKQHERMVKVAREACLQSRRLHLPEVGPIAPLADFLTDRPGAALADPDGEEIGAADRVLVVGPEGGLTRGERAGRRTIRLPGHVLRSETAAVVAAALACGLRR